jgi:hypothetical protein
MSKFAYTFKTVPSARLLSPRYHQQHARTTIATHRRRRPSLPGPEQSGATCRSGAAGPGLGARFPLVVRCGARGVVSRGLVHVRRRPGWAHHRRPGGPGSVRRAGRARAHLRGRAGRSPARSMARARRHRAALGVPLSWSWSRAPLACLPACVCGQKFASELAHIRERVAPARRQTANSIRRRRHPFSPCRRRHLSSNPTTILSNNLVEPTEPPPPPPLLRSHVIISHARHAISLKVQHSTTHVRNSSDRCAKPTHWLMFNPPQHKSSRGNH